MAEDEDEAVKEGLEDSGKNEVGNLKSYYWAKMKDNARAMI